MYSMPPEASRRPISTQSRRLFSRYSGTIGNRSLSTTTSIRSPAALSMFDPMQIAGKALQQRLLLERLGNMVVTAGFFASAYIRLVSMGGQRHNRCPAAAAELLGSAHH